MINLSNLEKSLADKELTKMLSSKGPWFFFEQTKGPDYITMYKPYDKYFTANFGFHTHLSKDLKPLLNLEPEITKQSRYYKVCSPHVNISLVVAPGEEFIRRFSDGSELVSPRHDTLRDYWNATYWSATSPDEYFLWPAQEPENFKRLVTKRLKKYALYDEYVIISGEEYAITMKSALEEIIDMARELHRTGRIMVKE